MTRVLNVEHVTSGYGRVRVLDGLSLTVPEGKVAVLLGTNGAGKTTTLRTIAGLLPVWSGQITVDGRRVDGLDPLDVARAGVTLVPEGRGVFPALTVRENLDVAAHARVAAGDRRRRVGEVLDRFPQLGARLAQRAGTLSGGEQQMLALARGLLARPRLLMIDELSTGLAPLVVEELYRTVRQMKEGGQTILLVEQYLTHALGVADVCYVLHKGRLSFVGDAGELLHSTEQTAGLYVRS
jgi:branched-chain amino acid transport system ATP-binding protein